MRKPYRAALHQPLLSPIIVEGRGERLLGSGLRTGCCVWTPAGSAIARHGCNRSTCPTPLRGVSPGCDIAVPNTGPTPRIEALRRLAIPPVTGRILGSPKPLIAGSLAQPRTMNLTASVPMANLLIFRGFIVRDQEVGGSNPLAPTISFNNLQVNHVGAGKSQPRSSVVSSGG